MTNKNDENSNPPEQTKEQARSPGIDDWVQAKQAGGRVASDEEDGESRLYISLTD